LEVQPNNYLKKNVVPSDLDIWVRNRNHNMNKFEELLKNNEMDSEFKSGKILE